MYLTLLREHRCWLQSHHEVSHSKLIVTGGQHSERMDVRALSLLGRRTCPLATLTRSRLSKTSFRSAQTTDNIQLAFEWAFEMEAWPEPWDDQRLRVLRAASTQDKLVFSRLLADAETTPQYLMQLVLLTRQEGTSSVDCFAMALAVRLDQRNMTCSMTTTTCMRTSACV